MQKLILTAAISGAEVTKELNPAIPYTIAEMVKEAKSSYDAGASIIHLHVRWDDGTPTQDRERYRQTIEAIKQECPDVIILPSTGGAVGMSAEERLQPLDLQPEMATLDCGTCNFGGDDVFENTETMIEAFASKMIQTGVKPECECFDKGMVDMAIRKANKGLIQKPMHFNLVLGVNGGIAATARDLTFLVDSLPEGSTWCVTGIGRSEFPMAAIAITMGGHVRVGFEDNVYLQKGKLAASNGELVAKVVELAKLLGREIATPSEARAILGITKSVVQI
ncbi:3-keto-5-aminohexanoate cleavage protein [Cohnella kolymensis]|uniref:3-keto-5-aminohexanoate cleavage protein n=1 Tax=Cohnella kolymensis TaxID=1590652 RepID=A0ABR5A7Z5_9BACL|nr:3-keto-5-aminohexanoate cleavage protein [Cohnella kolymensis]KIL37027.1 3-keto-5-aminohexanoate cleavage protein [Cohnella kolymensis]